MTDPDTPTPDAELSPEQPITRDWLRDTGFKWDMLPGDTGPRWLLWMGSCRACDRGTSSYDDFGIELVEQHNRPGVWMMFFRADYAGRYSRFLYGRDVSTVSQIARVVESLTDRPFDPADVHFGSLRTPTEAAKLRAESERLDWKAGTHSEHRYEIIREQDNDRRLADRLRQQEHPR